MFVEGRHTKDQTHQQTPYYNQPHIDPTTRLLCGRYPEIFNASPPLGFFSAYLSRVKQKTEAEDSGGDGISAGVEGYISYSRYTVTVFESSVLIDDNDKWDSFTEIAPRHYLTSWTTPAVSTTSLPNSHLAKGTDLNFLKVVALSLSVTSQIQLGHVALRAQ